MLFNFSVCFGGIRLDKTSHHVGCVCVCVCVCVRAPPHPLADAFILRQGDDGLHVLVGELCHGDALVPAGDVIGQNHCGEHREAVGHVQRAVVVVVVDARQLLKERERNIFRNTSNTLFCGRLRRSN